MHACNGTNGRTTHQSAKVEGLGVTAESRLRDSLRLRSPSEPWVDAQFREVLETDTRGEIVVKRLHDPSVFPPGGKRTKMMQCKICGIFNPPHAMEGGACLDHREDGGWGKSPSAESIRKIRFYFMRLSKIELAPESDEALEQEIRDYGQHNSVSRP